jgi:hydroxymethylpyrimidine/phosphomethylpyrimidine kinase
MATKRPPSAPAGPIKIAPRAVALTIAGSDPSGGAGLQADLKTFQQLGVYGMSVVTLLTVQNTQAVHRVEVLDPALIVEQFDAVMADIPPRAIKVGALGNAAVVRAIGERLQGQRVPLVVDPVLVSKHGHQLVTDDVVEAYKQYLIPHATLITPNRFEAERLTGVSLADPREFAEVMFRLDALGAGQVLLKLGAIDGQSHHVFGTRDENLVIATPRLDGLNTHGAGCILSASIAAAFALGVSEVEAAIHFGIHQTFDALSLNTRLGKGVHPADVRGMRGM